MVIHPSPPPRSTLLSLVLMAQMLGNLILKWMLMGIVGLASKWVRFVFLLGVIRTWHCKASFSLFSIFIFPDESRVLWGNPADVIDCSLTRTGVFAGQKWTHQQQPEPEQQEHWHYDQNQELQHFRVHRPFAVHSSCSWSTFWSFQHRGSSSPEQQPCTVLLPACYRTDYQPHNESARQC